MKDLKTTPFKSNKNCKIKIILQIFKKFTKKIFNKLTSLKKKLTHLTPEIDNISLKLIKNTLFLKSIKASNSIAIKMT
jgi:hypothetical protein